MWHRHMVQGHPPNGPGGAPLEWPLLRGIVPKLEGGNLVVDLPETSDAYLPAGHSHFGGWVLYRHMPYAGLPEVRTQVKKLALLLGKLRFPANVQASSGRPYPTSESDHSGDFDAAMQACLHRFEEGMRNSVGFQLSEAGKARLGTGTSEKETWAYLLGEPTIDVPVARIGDDSQVTQLEPGVVAQLMGQALLDWDAAGLRMHGHILVTRTDGKRTLHAVPEVLLGVRALEVTAKALGMPYPLKLSNTWRTLGAMEPGQAVRSNHKLGRAVDLEYGYFREPSGAMPLAFEAYRPSADQLRWQLYAHTTLDPFNEVDLEERLAKAQDTFRKEVEERIGSELPTLVKSFLARVKQLHDELISLGRSGKLGDAFFRATVSRFQPQAGQVAGGDRMEAVGAAEDARANGVGVPDEITSWLNLSRLAFRLGLTGISAHTNRLGPVSGDLSQEDSFTTIRPGDQKDRIPKALALDELASGIEALQRLGGRSVHVRTKDGKFIGVPVSSFHLDAIRSWMRRTSDPPRTLPPPPSEISFADNGVDMTITFVGASGQGLLRRTLEDYVSSRGSIPVKVLHVGGGLGFQGRGLVVGRHLEIRKVASELQQAFLIPGQPDRRIVLRPIYAPELPDADPATHTYRIVKTHEPQYLEWWHLQLFSEGLDWHRCAEQMGLSAKVLEATVLPRTEDVPPGVPWVGGAGVARSRFSPRPDAEPNNRPGRG